MAEQTKRLTDAELEALRGHTPGEWEVDTVRNVGEYGDGGPDSRSGFDSFAAVDQHGRVLFDTLNCDYGIASIREESDEDGARAWDEQGEKNIRLAAAAGALLAEVIERRAKDAAVAELVEAATEAAMWAAQILERGDVPTRIRDAAKGVSARLNTALAAARGGASHVRA